jgi:hypothetical protein
VLEVRTSDAFAQWFRSLDDATAEDVAATIDVVQGLGVATAAPGSRELLLWYEHPRAADFSRSGSFAWDFEAWASFRDYAGHVVARLEAPRFLSRIGLLEPKDAETVLGLVRRIRRLADPRTAWTAAARGIPRKWCPDAAAACAELRRLYLATLEAAGFDVVDVPAHSLAVREIARRQPAPGLRLLYGVDVARDVALFVVGEPLGRTFYGDSVRRAEAAWAQFLAGQLPSGDVARAT